MEVIGVMRNMVVLALAIIAAALLLADLTLLPADFARPQKAVANGSPDIGSSVQHARSILAGSPLIFEVNRGQADREVRFLARGQGFTIFLTAREAVIVASPELPAAPPDPDSLELLPPLSGTRRSEAKEPVRLRFVDAEAVEPQGEDELPGKSNYFIGARSVTGIRQYARIAYRGLYPGIDLVFYSRQGLLEYDFVVKPGGDPQRIRLEVDSTQAAAITFQGHVAIGQLTKEKPYVYQQCGDQRIEIASQFALTSGNRISFRLRDFDRTRPLTIDPRIVMKRYYGGSLGELANGAARDSSGNLFIVGRTTSLDFPTKQPFQKKPGGSVECFVVKLSPKGVILYSTYLGGVRHDSPLGVALGPLGNAYIVGSTSSSDFPVRISMSPPPSATEYEYVGFLTKLSASGSSLVYSTFLPASPSAIAVRDGYAYLAGATGPSLPVVNAMQPESAGMKDAFLMKVNQSGTALVYSSYLGGKGQDLGRGIAIDSSGAVYIAGQTTSPDFPITANAFQPKIAGECWNTPSWCGIEVFLTKIDLDKRRFVYSSYLGGSAGELFSSMTVDGQNNVYVTGNSNSKDFPFVNAILSRKTSPVWNAFISKVNRTGSALIYSTYLGSGGVDDLVVDRQGNACVTGFGVRSGTGACTLVIKNPIPGSPTCGLSFAGKLTPTGSLIFASYLDTGWGNYVVLGQPGTFYVVGQDFRADDFFVAQIDSR